MVLRVKMLNMDGSVVSCVVCQSLPRRKDPFGEVRTTFSGGQGHEPSMFAATIAAMTPAGAVASGRRRSNNSNNSSSNSQQQQ